MKYIIIVPDGMADYPQESLGRKTPLEVANTPFMDKIAKAGVVGCVKTIPDDMDPGSDVANLSILGYDPKIYYSGRAPLEAASIGIELGDSDVAYRCNLVTFREENGKIYMDDYSAGHISKEDGKALLLEIKEHLSSKEIEFYPGVSYRHIMVWRGGEVDVLTTPPHDITGEEITPYLPKGKGSHVILNLMERSKDILKKSEINRKIREKGGKGASSIWLWGQGKAPKIPHLSERYPISGGIISAVDLIKGIGIYAGLSVIDVPGATGYLDTNYFGKAIQAIDFLISGDFIFVHIEAPDEAGHAGDMDSKIKAIEDIDRKVLKTILKGLERLSPYRLLLLPDHPTPCNVRTHTKDPVPFILYDSKVKIEEGKGVKFCEKLGKDGPFISFGHKLIDELFGKGVGLI